MAADHPQAPPAEPPDYFRLRADWLRFKNHVFDANTGLPTLAAALDDVRRLVEERGTLLLVYLDLGGGGLESVHGWHAYDEILREFAATLANLRKQGLLEARDIVSVLAVRGDKFVVFLGGSGGSPTDERSSETVVARLRSRIVEEFPQSLPFAPSPITFHDGYALLHRDPMLRAERGIHRALDEAMYMSLRRRTREEDRRAIGLDAIIRERKVVTLYQPIVDLRTLRVLGHEVFTRGPLGGPFEDAEGLFALAERTGRLLDLERLCRRQALGSTKLHLHPGEKLFLNTSAGALEDSEVAGPAFVQHVAEQGLKQADVVLEITERAAAAERRAYHHILKDLKREGFGIAIDDMGAGYSSLRAVVELEPDYMKFDISLVRHIDRSLIKRSLLETLVDLSGKIGAEVIAEGIEAESEFATLRDLGVRLGQGRYLAPPVALSTEAWT